MFNLKIAVIIPVKTFSKAKTRLGLSPSKTEQLCKVMLEEIISTISISPKIEKTILVTKESEAVKIGQKYNAKIIVDQQEEGVNGAVVLADRFLLENNFDASIVLPQDIPFIKTEDIDFMLNYMMPPNFAIIVPSSRFDGTNALVRMPVDLMETHYDEDSYKIHMSTAKEKTLNVAMVFVKRVMWDIDYPEDLRLMLERPEKPDFVERVARVLKSNRDTSRKQD